MTANPAFTHRLRVAHLNPRAPTPVIIQPDAQMRAAISDDLGLLDLPALSFDGSVQAQGNDAWVLTGRLTARVVQPCVVTLDPVESPIDEQIRRVFSPHVTAPLDDDIEMPDDEIEPLGQFIDVGVVMVEALALALPLYPRADGAILPETDQPDTAEPEEDRQKPFAGLGDLLSKKTQ